MKLSSSLPPRNVQRCSIVETSCKRLLTCGRAIPLSEWTDCTRLDQRYEYSSCRQRTRRCGLKCFLIDGRAATPVSGAIQPDPLDDFLASPPTRRAPCQSS